MDPARPYRPRVSRESRMLLTAGALALAALWLLARIRFRDLPVTPNPVPAVLSQLTNGPTHDDLAVEIAQLQTRLEGWLLALGPLSDAPGSPQTSQRIGALKFGDDVGVTLLPAGSTVADGDLVARDPASGLAVVRVGRPAPVSSPVLWVPRRLSQPRYLVASDVSSKGVSLRPVFVGSLDPVDSPLWPQALWGVPERSDLAPGSFVFTNNGELVGVVIADGVDRAIVPGATLLAEADRLLARPATPAGTIGVDVEALTEPVASVTGARAGVVVTWVERDGPAAGRVVVGDVIEAVDGGVVASRRHWDVRVARLSAGETLMLTLRRGGELRDEALVASGPVLQPSSRSLGLTLRRRTGIGAEVLRVERASAADSAGLTVGDVITLVSGVSAPTPAQVMSAFAAVGQGQRMMVAVTRGAAHHVTTVAR